jgi:hypothetical protein
MGSSKASYKKQMNKDHILLEAAYEKVVNNKSVKTFGDLLKIIQGIQIKNKGGKIVDKGINFAIDQVLGLVPGASNAKTAYEFLKTIFERPDTKKTNTVVDRLNVDDQVAAIVDSSVEQKFLIHLVDLIKKHGVETPIPDDWNITKELQTFLQSNFNSRTVSVPTNH